MAAGYGLLLTKGLQQPDHFGWIFRFTTVVKLQGSTFGNREILPLIIFDQPADVENLPYVIGVMRQLPVYCIDDR